MQQLQLSLLSWTFACHHCSAMHTIYDRCIAVRAQLLRLAGIQEKGAASGSIIRHPSGLACKVGLISHLPDKQLSADVSEDPLLCREGRSCGTAFVWIGDGKWLLEVSVAGMKGA